MYLAEAMQRVLAIQDPQPSLYIWHRVAAQRKPCLGIADCRVRKVGLTTCVDLDADPVPSIRPLQSLVGVTAEAVIVQRGERDRCALLAKHPQRALHSQLAVRAGDLDHCAGVDAQVRARRDGYFAF